MEEIEGFQQGCRRKQREPVMQAPGCLFRSDWGRHLEQDIAGIESFIHLA